MRPGGTDIMSRLADLAGWLYVGFAGPLLLTQAVGWDGTRLVATLHSLTPYLALVLVPVAGIACWSRRHGLAIVAAMIGLGSLLLASPLVFTPNQPQPIDNATGLRVASVNLFYENPNVGDIGTALDRPDIDVIVFSEYTAEHQRVLLAHPLASSFPHRVERDGLRAGGIAIWSRVPLVDGVRPDTVNYSLDLLAAGPDGDVRILGVHPPTPVFDFAGWRRDLDLIGDVGLSRDEPTLIVGDFNASYWHPPFRRLLRRGFVDAHMADGRGFAVSWPTNRAIPPFVQLDHALTGNGLVSTAVDDVALPGSDHRGFIVTVVPGR
ncbi:MAG: endonuclease/exonuclease/phosphatase family protein [Ilumatobacter sp.]|nr:endonuclease/exonuclease/phosphatase family protein [Ilumatobacter sp.]